MLNRFILSLIIHFIVGTIFFMIAGVHHSFEFCFGYQAGVIGFGLGMFIDACDKERKANHKKLEEKRKEFEKEFNRYGAMRRRSNAPEPPKAPPRKVI